MAVIKIVPMPGAKGDKGDEGATGAQGPQGPIGATGPAGADAAWYYNGAYNPGASYVVGDVVTYDGQTWYRKNANGGNVGDTPSEGLFWDLIAAKGADGSQLNYWDGIEQPNPFEPAEPGFLIVDGITNNQILQIMSANRVYIGGNNGEFINDPNNPLNQIATLGDIENAISSANSSAVFGNNSSIELGPNAPATIAGNIGGWPIPFNYEISSNNISYDLNEEGGIITFSETGIYSVTLSAQFEKSDHSEVDIIIWMQEEHPNDNFRIANTTRRYRIKEDFSEISYHNTLNVTSIGYKAKIMIHSPHTCYLSNIPANSVPLTGNPSSGSVLLTLHKIGE